MSATGNHLYRSAGTWQVHPACAPRAGGTRSFSSRWRSCSRTDTPSTNKGRKQVNILPGFAARSIPLLASSWLPRSHNHYHVLIKAYCCLLHKMSQTCTYSTYNQWMTSNYDTSVHQTVHILNNIHVFTCTLSSKYPWATYLRVSPPSLKANLHW